KGAIHILHIIDLKHKYEFDDNIPDNKISQMIREYQTNIEEDIEKEKIQYEEKLKNEIEEVNNSNLSDLDKSIWIKNLNLMQDYRIQRAVNKLYYEHAISIIVDIIKKNKITSMDLPFNKSYFHLAESIQNALDRNKYHIKSDIEIQNDNSELRLKFTIHHRNIKY
ncbi:MAG: hypothetical protein KAU90_05815, partial [Sulfurovaceae bacterium]|nr:hypothetical protein [Sulfurovaceae bacterium]